MARNMFYRDFTLCKAAALVALIGLAAALGGVPHASEMAKQAPDGDNEARLLSATVWAEAWPCAQDGGIRL
jgi:hypothetical protein